MNKVNVAVIYYSMTGNNSQMARWAEESAKALGAEVRLRKIDDGRTPNPENPAWVKEHNRSKDVTVAASADLEWADVVVFVYATRFGGLAAPLKAFIDSQGGLWGEGKLTNKVVTGITSAENDHGGQEMALMSLYVSMAHWGAIPIFPGYTDEALFGAGGNPYGTSATAVIGSVPGDNIKAAVNAQVKRTVEIAARLKG